MTDLRVKKKRGYRGSGISLPNLTSIAALGPESGAIMAELEHYLSYQNVLREHRPDDVLIQAEMVRLSTPPGLEVLRARRVD